MPITIHYEINGHQTILQPHRVIDSSESLENILLRLDETLSQHLSDLECPDHRQWPMVTVVASLEGPSGFRIQGCCPQLVSTTRQAIHRLLAQAKQYMASGGWLTLTLPATGMTVCVAGTALGDRWVIGRRDPDSAARPQLDLTAHDALANGISRQHAALMWQAGTFYVVDLASTNHSYLNEARLFPHKPQKLHPDDHLRLGKFVIHISIL